MALFLAVTTASAIAVHDYHSRWTPIERHYLSMYVRTEVLATLGVTAEARLHAATLHAFLQHAVYNDLTLKGLMSAALWGGLAAGLAALVLAIPRDLVRSRERRHGRRLRGPELVTVTQFNRRWRSDGIGFRQRSSLLVPGCQLKIPSALESSHFLIVGDSGTGKSVLIRQMLQQIDQRGETAIVYDPALEYISQFYTPERGDLILNPLDARSPYWTPSDEWRCEAETLTIASSLFPDRHHENAFFTEAPRRIFAHLLTLRPSPEELAEWLSGDDAIDSKVAHTAYAAMINRQAPAQRAGVLASLNMVADTLKLLPRERDTSVRWSATAWANQWPRGWLFLTSTPETRLRLIPLMSLWIDTLVLRLMNQGRPCRRRTWLMLDELASLQRLPQLHTAITENRKSNNPVVLGFQGRSQLETRYGHDSEAMLSQPATKIFLRTSEAHAAKWIADTIGDVEIERLRESRSTGRRLERTYALERQVEPLVMGSEIGGLESLRAFLKLGNMVVRMQWSYVTPTHRAQPLVERSRDSHGDQTRSQAAHSPQASEQETPSEAPRTPRIKRSPRADGGQRLKRAVSNDLERARDN